MRLSAVVLISTILLLAGCVLEDEKDDDGFVFPMKVGNTWEYSIQGRDYNFRPDSLEIPWDDTLYTISSILKVDRIQTLLNSVQTYVIQEKCTVLDSQIEKDTYYKVSNSGIYLVAYEYGQSGVTLKQTANKNDYPNWRKRRMPDFIGNARPAPYNETDSLYYEEDWPMVIQYPFKIGSAWDYRAENSGKVVEGIEQVTVPAGTFECYKIRYVYLGDWVDKVHVQATDYICSAGLVRRHILMTGIQNPGSDLVWDYEENAVLTDYDLK